MKEYTKDFWIETNPDGTVNVGLTDNLIQSKLQECFHILQANTLAVKENEPMLVLETNDGLESLKSPVTGTVLKFNDRARNFPDKIKEDEVVLHLCPVGVKMPVVKRPRVNTRANQQRINDLLMMPQPDWWANAAQVIEYGDAL